MTDGLESTLADNGSDVPARSGKPRARAKVARALLYASLLAVSAGIVYAVLRGACARPVDPTTERIRSLIDEANRLLKELDDKRSG
jgi:hypothetical protein